MKRFLIAALIIISILVEVSLSEQPTQATSVREKLIEWRKGIWLSGGSTYTIWTPRHYFVLSMSGDSTNANLYYGCSQVTYHEKGVTRHQVQRYRKFPGGDLTMFWDYMLTDTNSEKPYTPDTTLFNPNACAPTPNSIGNIPCRFT